MSETESFHLQAMQANMHTLGLIFFFLHRQLEKTFFSFNRYLDCTLDIFM